MKSIIYILIFLLHMAPSSHVLAMEDMGFYDRPSRPNFRFPECLRYFLSTGTDLAIVQRQPSLQIESQRELAVFTEISAEELQTLSSRINTKAEDVYQQMRPMFPEVFENSRAISDILESSITRSKGASRDFLTIRSEMPDIKNVTDSIETILAVIKTLALDKNNSPAKAGGFFSRFFPTGPIGSSEREGFTEMDLLKIIGFEHNLEKHKDAIKQVETHLNLKLRYAKNLKKVMEAEIEYLNLLSSKIQSDNSILKSDKSYISGLVASQLNLIRTQLGLIEVRTRGLIDDIELTAKQLLHLESIDTNITMARAVYAAQFVAIDKIFLDNLKRQESDAREAALLELERKEEERLKAIENQKRRVAQDQEAAEKARQNELLAARLLKEKEEDLAYIDTVYSENLERVNPEIVRLLQLYIYGPFGIKHESIESFVSEFKTENISFADLVYISVQLLRIHEPTITRRHSLVYPTFTKNIDTINSKVNEYLANLNLPWNYFALLTYLNRLTQVTTALHEVKFLETILKRILLDSKAIEGQDRSSYLSHIGYFAHKVLTEPAGYMEHKELAQKRESETKYLNNRNKLLEIAESNTPEISQQVRELIQKLRSMSPEKAKKDLLEFLENNPQLDFSIHEIAALLSLSDNILLHSLSKTSVTPLLRAHLDAYGLAKLDSNSFYTVQIPLNIVQRLRTLNTDVNLYNLAQERIHLLFKSSSYHKETVLKQTAQDRATTESDFSELVTHFMRHPDGIVYLRARKEREAQQAIVLRQLEQIQVRASELEAQVNQSIKDVMDKLLQDLDGFNIVKLRQYLDRHPAVSLPSLIYIANRLPLDSTNSKVSETNWGGYFVKKYESIIGRDFRSNNTSVISFEVDFILGQIAQLQSPITDPLISQFFKNLLTKDQEALIKRRGFSSGWTAEVLKAFDVLASNPPGYTQRQALIKELKILNRKIDMESQTRIANPEVAAVAKVYLEEASPILKKLYFAEVSNEFYFNRILDLTKAGFYFNKADFLLMLGRPPEELSQLTYPVHQIDKILKFYKLDTTNSNAYSFHILNMLLLLERTTEPYSLQEEAYIRAAFSYVFAKYVSENSNTKSTVELFDKLVNAIFDRLNSEADISTN